MKLGFSQERIIDTAKSLGLPTDGFVQRRVARAFDLVETNKVTEVDDGIFRVRSQYDASKAYIVNVNSGAPSCDCPDGERTINCKHRIASLLYARKQSQAKQALSIKSTTDGKDGDFWRRSWLIAQGNRRIVVYEEHDLRLDFAKEVEGVRNQDKDGRLFCNCGAYYQDCEHKQLVIRTVTNELKAIAKPIKADSARSLPSSDCGTDRAKAIQEKLNGQIDSQNDNGNGAKAPSQPTKLDLRDPFQQSEQLDIDQIEGRANGELVHKLSNGEYVISYKGIMTLSEKHHITFDEAIHDDTHTAIAKGHCGTSERVSGKPINGNANTALELAKRNAARQLLPYAEQLATVKKFQLEAEFDWQTAYEKCAKLAGGKAQVDVIINDLVNWGKLKQDNPSGYNRGEWLLIHEYCTGGFVTADNHQKEASIERDPGSTNNWSYNSAVFLERCKEAIEQVRVVMVGDKPTSAEKSIEANELPPQSADGKRRLQMDKKFRTWLIEADSTRKPISCREICEQFEDGSIVTRLRAGIDSGADISRKPKGVGELTVELD